MQINFNKKVEQRKGFFKGGNYIILEVKPELDASENDIYRKLSGDEVVWEKNVMNNYEWVIGKDFGVEPIEQVVGVSFHEIKTPDVAGWLIDKIYFPSFGGLKIVSLVGKEKCSVRDLIWGIKVEFPDKDGNEPFIRAILIALYKRMKKLYFQGDSIAI